MEKDRGPPVRISTIRIRATSDMISIHHYPFFCPISYNINPSSWRCPCSSDAQTSVLGAAAGTAAAPGASQPERGRGRGGVLAGIRGAQRGPWSRCPCLRQV